MPPFELLYGRKCTTLIFWGEVGQRVMRSIEVVLKTMKLLQQVHGRLQIAKSRHKSYIGQRYSDLDFRVRDLVLLKVSPQKYVRLFQKQAKLGPQYISPFSVIDPVGKVAYRLDLPVSLVRPATPFMFIRCESVQLMISQWYPSMKF